MNNPQFPAQLEATYSKLRANFSKTARDYTWRVKQLTALKKMITDNDDAISEAMWKDLRKSKFECAATEQGIVLSEIDFTLKHLDSWMRIKRVATPIFNQPGTCHIRRDPLGLALIIGAWNYPINLLLAPLVGAIAGGNAVILKPSELADATAKVIARLVPLYLDPDLIAVLEAGAEDTSLLLDKQFDTIFFTGSGTVGKIVMAKAAPHLTPVTLELGGKSPALVLSDADIEVASRRIAWGKFMNAGQTCVAPDYILIQPSIKDQFVVELKRTIEEFYGADPKQSPDYCRIVNAKNYGRLTSFLKGAKILHGGATAEDDLYIEPTLLDAKLDDKVMQEEIFGPILPIIEVDGLDQMIAHVNSYAKPLSLYLFTRDSANEERVLGETSSGGVCVNDVVMHMPVPDLPFGGVGASGMGHYHGKFSFDTFTHAKGVLKKATWIDVPLRYAPYTMSKLRWMRRLI